MKQYQISIYLDKRRSKSNGTFPVKLRVYDCISRKAKLFPTVHDYTVNEFHSIWETSKPKKEFKERRLKLSALENRANLEAETLDPFTFESFKKKMFRHSGDGQNVFFHYLNRIEHLKEKEQHTTSELYELSMKSIKKFAKSDKLLFNEVTPNWLETYEHYMTAQLGRSLTTVSIYLRNLRAIFNEAIELGDTNNYPFGKKKYQIPNVKKVKKALNQNQLKTFYKAPTKTKEQEKAKDFWFFSYCCNGMNIKDIALLKNENLNENRLIFYRAKTIRTSKSSLEPVVVYLTNLPKEILSKYRRKSADRNSLIFDILDGTESPERQRSKIKNFTRFINQHIQNIAKENNLPQDITTYWARHSFATNAIRNGASMEFVGEALNHSNVKTTQGYFAGFEDVTKRKIMEDLIKF